MRAAKRCESAASPNITGTMGWVPGLIVRPIFVMFSRKYFVFSSNRSRSSVDAETISMAFSEAATTHGATVLENR